MSRCLCGHFEWCELCSTPTKYPDNMTAADFGQSATVTIEPDAGQEAALEAARALGKQLLRGLLDELTVKAVRK